MKCKMCFKKEALPERAFCLECVQKSPEERIAALLAYLGSKPKVRVS